MQVLVIMMPMPVMAQARMVKMAVTPGIDFDPVRGARTLRFSYAQSTADIAEGLDRLARWMAAR